MINKKNVILAAVLFFSAILSRAPLIEHLQSHWDGPQYSIGIVRYSLTQDTPAPPGYPIYIAMGKFFYVFTHDPHLALLIISVLFSGIGVVIFYLAGQRIFNQSVGIINALLFLSGPTFYFFGLTAYAYGITPVISTALALVVFLIAREKKKLGFLLGLLFSLAIGFRIQDIFFLTPLFFYGLYCLPKNQKIVASISFILITFVWLFPLLNVVGGLQEYIRLCSTFAQNDSLPSPGIMYPIINRMTIVKGFFLSFSIGLLFLLFYPYTFLHQPKGKIIKKNAKMFLFFALWIIPSLLFNLFIRSDHAGHQMTYLSGTALLIAYAIYKVTYKSKLFFIASVFLIVSSNLFTFFRDRDPNFTMPYVATSFHYSEIRKNDIKLGSKIQYVKTHFSPQSTLIITSSYLWRPIMYYLKDYQVDDIEALVTTDPQYRDIRRDAHDWNRKEYTEKKYLFNVPENITTIVLFEDESKKWIQRDKAKDVILPGNSTITIMETKPGKQYSYSYAKLREK